MRILKDLRAQTWDTGSRWSSRSLRADKASQCKSRFCKALGKLCTLCYLAGNCRQRETELRQRKCARLAFERDARHRGVMNRHARAQRAVPLRQGPVVRVFSPGAFRRQRPRRAGEYDGAPVKNPTAGSGSGNQRENATLMNLLARSCTIFGT